MLRPDRAGWEEWKPHQQLERLAEKMPQRYQRLPDGCWRCPPGEAYAAQFGLYYQVRTAAEFSPTYQRNVAILEDYLLDAGQHADQAVQHQLVAAALIANGTLNPIVGAELSGREALAGLPGTLLLLGAAAAAQPAGHLMQRVGRRWGLGLGFFIGLVGMLIGGSAIMAHSFIWFLLGLLLIGAARGAVDQSRYAAADAQRPDRRARAISTVVFAGTIGAVVGPKLVGPAGNLLAGLGVTPLAEPMWSGAMLFGLSGLLITICLRPDPRDMARAIASAHSDTRQPSGPAGRCARLCSCQPRGWHWSRWSSAKW